ncbi:MAG: hypothetical protein JW924_11225 [Fusobacteriaceae bacterium]|nr:hypothetical protein [Fusobacteriaceae bacterium]
MSKLIDKKVIPISSKRQITIPIKFFRALDFDSEVECIFTGEEIILKPSSKESGYFAQEILNELVDSGYKGDELKKEFAKRSKEVKPAVKKLLKDVSQYTKESMKNYKDETEDIFGTEEK